MKLTSERLEDLLHYDPRTGLWCRRHAYGSRPAGSLVGEKTSHGYIRISIDGVRHYSHRLAFLYVTGRWPSEVDHVNGVKHDNSWANLREVTRTLNNANRARTKTRKLPKGVTQAISRGKKINLYFARINCNKKLHYLGCFKSPQMAAAAYAKAAKIHFGSHARTE